jgi:hypothetical protein
MKGETAMSWEAIGNEIRDTEIQILKEATCPSLSGKSTLTYHVGITPESEILFRIDANSGTGKFNRQWIPLSSILDQLPSSDESFSWAVLSPLYRKQSVNSSGFLLAALRNEGQLAQFDGKYRRVDPETFVAGTREPMASTQAMKKPKKALPRRATPPDGQRGAL